MPSPLLGGRYVLQCILGRGGFSEVFKAYDVEEMRYVACKIHQLATHWTEEHKRSYVRHAVRETSSSPPNLPDLDAFLSHASIAS